MVSQSSRRLPSGFQYLSWCLNGNAFASPLEHAQEFGTHRGPSARLSGRHRIVSGRLWTTGRSFGVALVRVMFMPSLRDGDIFGDANPQGFRCASTLGYFLLSLRES